MTYIEYLTRRRSPQWVREWSSETLHGVAGMLTRTARSKDLTRGQETLWAAVISELEYRHRSARRANQWACYCDYCLPPFE